MVSCVTSTLPFVKLRWVQVGHASQLHIKKGCFGSHHEKTRLEFLLHYGGRGQKFTSFRK
jgi:hypothetical protein